MVKIVMETVSRRVCVPTLILFGGFLVAGCTTAQIETRVVVETEESVQTLTPSRVSPGEFADVISVTVSGEPRGYSFSVEISSPDQGCNQYADWWEVLTEDGELVYRRILLHSHVDEQPFIRSGGPVPIEVNTEVFIRAHMAPFGYGRRVLRGSVASGFEGVDVDIDFPPDIETSPPLPDGCAF